MGFDRNVTYEPIVFGFTDDHPFDLRGGFGRYIAQEFRLVQRFLKGLDRSCFEQFDGTATADIAVSEHRFAVSVPIEGVTSFSGDLLEQLRWYAVCLVERRGFCPIDHRSTLAAHVAKETFDSIQS